MLKTLRTETAPPDSWDPPKEFDGFVITGQLGQGGMGQVYLARDRDLDRQVAIKFIAGDGPIAELRERFLREARAIARLQHANVVSVFRIGEVREHPYIAYEYVEGKSLDQLEEPLPWHGAFRVALGLARGLAAAHARGVLHRDIKPANAMMTEDGEVKLIDFGIAKLLGEGIMATFASAEVAPSGPALTAVSEGSETANTTTLKSAKAEKEDDTDKALQPGPLTSPGSLLGTPLYIAPELWNGAPASPRSDVYSLGLLLYEICGGELPLADLSVAEMSRAIPKHEHSPLRASRPEVPELFAQVIDRCIQRDPAARFASADDLRRALEQVDGVFRALRMVEEDFQSHASDDWALVRASYARIAPFADHLARGFYERLFERHPELRSMFPADMREQDLKFTRTLQLIIESLRKPSHLEPLLRELGRRHAAYGVRPHQFEMVGAALLDAVQDLDRAAWNDALGSAWKDAYALLSSNMKEGLLSAK